MRNFKRYQLYFLVLLIAVIAVAAWLYFSKNKTTQAPMVNNDQQTQINQNNTSQNNTAASNELLNNSALAVSTQISGNSANIDNYYLEQPGFIIISSSTADGKPGNIIAQSGYLNKGSGQDLEISTKLQAGKNYFASIYLDSNGDKKFNPATDKPVSNNNNLLNYKFTVGN